MQSMLHTQSAILYMVLPKPRRSCACVCPVECVLPMFCVCVCVSVCMCIGLGSQPLFARAERNLEDRWGERGLVWCQFILQSVCVFTCVLTEPRHFHPACRVSSLHQSLCSGSCPSYKCVCVSERVCVCA